MLLVSVLVGFLCIALQSAQAWLINRRAGYYEYPARICAGSEVIIMNGVDSNVDLSAAPRKAGLEFRELVEFLFAGGANIRNLPGCSRKTMDLASVDVLFYLHPKLELDGHLQLHSKEWILRARQQFLPCVSPEFYSRTVLVIDGYVLSVFGGEPFAQPCSDAAYVAAFERILSNRYSLTVDRVPSAQRLSNMVPIVASAKGIVKNRLYSFGGFNSTFWTLHNDVVVHDISNRYVEIIKIFPLPPGLPVAFQAAATDNERYIYVAGGQTEAGCSYGSRVVFRFDTATETFLRLPDLPYHVQSGQLVLMKSTNSLHYTGGSFNRSVDIFPYAPHFILKLPSNLSRAVDWKQQNGAWHWREGAHLHQSTRLHHISIVLVDGLGQESLYVIGGVLRDAGIGPLADVGVPMPAHQCIVSGGEPELRDVYKYSPRSKKHWQRMMDLPIALSHADASTVIVSSGRGILTFGGQTTIMRKDRATRKVFFDMAVSRQIILYIPSMNISRIVGYLPQWFRGEGVKELTVVRERIIGDTGETTDGGVLLFGGERSSVLEPPNPEPPFVSEDMIRISLNLVGVLGEEIGNSGLGTRRTSNN